MTGLDKILERITAEAGADADSIISEAQAQAESIISEAQVKAEEECAKIIAKARDDAALLDHISRSSAEMEGKKLLLATRQQVISDVLDDAARRLKGMSGEQYFLAAESIALRYAHSGEGELVLSKADRERMPKDFVERLNSKLPEGSRLALSDDTVETGGGFILRYGGVEENCTFSALIEQQREELSDRLSALLFA